MIKVLFVCLGNICRSPMAEGIFNSLLREKGLEKKIQADSAGTSGWHIGESPDTRTLEIAEENGVTIRHAGKKFVPEHFDEFQYIIAMDRDNLQDIRDLLSKNGKEHNKIFKMREFDNNQSGKDVPDPYYGGHEDFKFVFDILHESCTNLFHFIKKDNPGL
jgi:protein-tyrosine phosphatase